MPDEVWTDEIGIAKDSDIKINQNIYIYILDRFWLQAKNRPRDRINLDPSFSSIYFDPLSNNIPFVQYYIK